jgi:ABC-type iron transport system FetAB ATPase subunit
MPLDGVATTAANEPGRSDFHAGTSILHIRDLRTSLAKPASLSLSAGECIAIRGPSGAGRTLLLRAIADPSDGVVSLDGPDGSPKQDPSFPVNHLV